MIKISRDSFFSPLGIFIFYILASALVVIGFRHIFPGEAAPLVYFSASWRFVRGLLDYLGLFPALVFSALVIPFGFRIQGRERINPFSPQFLQSLKGSIITAIAAAALYGLLFSLVLPLARNYEADLRARGRLYRIAKERAEERAAEGEWTEAAQFLAICEGIWPNSPETAKLKTEADIQVEQARVSPLPLPAPLSEAGEDSPAGSGPLDATKALAMAEEALAEERYFDAHWLASLAGRLAAPGSVETDMAARLAGRAWNGVNSLAPNERETAAHDIFRLKREGYQALLAEKQIQAYYTFRELIALSPEDPDAAKYLAMSENGIKQEAFFIDEMELTLGRILPGAVFSLPLGAAAGPGRLVMRIASLSTSTDSAYGMGVEILAFDRDGRPLWGMEAPYAKILPLVLDSGPSVLVLMQALDREDKTKHWEPRVWGIEPDSPAGVQTALAVSWDNFLLLSNIHQGLSGLSPAELQKAARQLGNSGREPEVFEAELLRRFAEPLLLLPLGIFAIVIGWQYRALKRPRYMGIPMLGILPLVFTGAVYFYRGWINNLGIWAVVSLGFTSAAMVFGIGIFALLVLSLIILAAQHG